MFLKREFLLIIFLGFLISSITSFLYLNKYDQINNHNVMIRGDIHFIWKEAEILKKDLHNGKNFFSSGTEYRRTYLPSKLLAIYSYLTGYELFENFDEEKSASPNNEEGQKKIDGSAEKENANKRIAGRGRPPPVYEPSSPKRNLKMPTDPSSSDIAAAMLKLLQDQAHSRQARKQRLYQSWFQ